MRARACAVLLRLLRHDVVTAENGEQGLAMARGVGVASRPARHRPARRRRLRGRAPAQGRSGHPPSVLVAVTGYGTQEDRKRALAAGFDEHLAKPVEPDELDAHAAAGRRTRRRGRLSRRAQPICAGLPALIIQEVPKRSTSMPNDSTQKVGPIGIVTLPPTDDRVEDLLALGRGRVGKRQREAVHAVVLLARHRVRGHQDAIAELQAGMQDPVRRAGRHAGGRRRLCLRHHHLELAAERLLVEAHRLGTGAVEEACTVSSWLMSSPCVPTCAASPRSPRPPSARRAGSRPSPGPGGSRSPRWARRDSAWPTRSPLPSS